MWLLLLIIYFVLGAASYLFRRVLAQKLGDKAALMSAVFFICFLFPVGFVFSFFVPNDLNVGWVNFFYLLFGSLVWPLMNIAAYAANRYLDVGIFTVINNLSPIITIAIAVSLLGESITILQSVGVIMLLTSGIIAALAQSKTETQSGLLGIGLSILAAVLLGIGVAYERFMLTQVDFGAYIVYGWGAQILWAAIIARKELHLIPSLFSKTSKVRGLIFCWGATNALKSTAFISALKLGTASLVSAAANFLSVVVVIAAYIFLRERNNTLYKLTAVALGIAGLFLTAG